MTTVSKFSFFTWLGINDIGQCTTAQGLDMYTYVFNNTLNSLESSLNALILLRLPL